MAISSVQAVSPNGCECTAPAGNALCAATTCLLLLEHYRLHSGDRKTQLHNQKMTTVVTMATMIPRSQGPIAAPAVATATSMEVSDEMVAVTDSKKLLGTVAKHEHPRYGVRQATTPGGQRLI